MAILRFGERLVRAGVITPEQLETLLEEQRATDASLGELAVRLGFATPEQIAEVLAEMTGLPYESLARRRPDPALADLVDEEFARQRQLVPVARDGNRLTVALANPLDVVAIDTIRERTGLDVEAVVSSEREIRAFQDELYGRPDDGDRFHELVEAARRAVVERDERGGRELGPVRELVEELLREAIRRRATDVHVEPEEHGVRVRYRVDGMLVPAVTLPPDLRATVTARLKILADLDISESRLPQDGRIRMELEGRKIDRRGSTIPCVHGENVVLRLLDKANVVKGLDRLGMAAEDLDRFRSLLATQAGMILVTGPTGSGKTTTLYSAIASLDAERFKIATLEDPVEYELPLVRQSQVHEKAGFTFAAGLRALLRQDPDIIFVGEMRDPETASIAVRAALTGHLVLSTLHTTSALSTLARLAQMGIPQDLVITSVRGILAQRLVRIVCETCAEDVAPDPVLVRRLGLSPADLEGARLRRGRGCARCNGTGFRGRTGLYELVVMTPELADAFAAGAPPGELARIAAASGTRFLRDDGLAKARAGITTLGEVLRATADAAARAATGPGTATPREEIHA